MVVKPTKKKVDKKAKLEEALLLTLDSFQSHIAGSFREVHKNKCCRQAVGKPSFHVTCLKEYLQIMSAIVEQL